MEPDVAMRKTVNYLNYVLSTVCGVDLSCGTDDDGTQALSRKLMTGEDAGYEDAVDDFVVPPPPRASGWLSPVYGGGAAGDATDSRHGVSTYRSPSPVRPQYAPPSPLEVNRADAPGPATWTEASISSPNPLVDLNALMARVEELEALGDLDAAARLLSGAIQRR